MDECRISAEELLKILMQKLGIKEKPKPKPAPKPEPKIPEKKLNPLIIAPPGPVLSKKIEVFPDYFSPKAKKQNRTLVAENTKKLPRPKTNLSGALQEHVTVLAKYFNIAMDGDELLVKSNLLPLHTSDDDLIQKISDGLILAKFINIAQPGTIDIRAMNTDHWHDPKYHPFLHNQGGIGSILDKKGGEKEKKNKKTVLDMQGMMENITLVLESAKSIGVQLGDIRAKHLLHAYRSPEKAVGFLWNLLVVRVESVGSARTLPDLVNLFIEECQGDYKECVTTSMNMGPRDMILRWITHHARKGLKYAPDSIVNATNQFVVPTFESLKKNMGPFNWMTTIMVGLSVQHNIAFQDACKAGKEVSKEEKLLQDSDAAWAMNAIEEISHRPIQKMLRSIGAKEAALFMIPEMGPKSPNILDKTLEQNIWKRGFSSLGFFMMSNPGLFVPEEKKSKRTESVKRAKAELMTDDVGDRLERAFRMWINSIGIPGVYIQNLFLGCRDGLVLLKVMDKIVPGSVPWKKVEMKPNNKFKRISNCTLVVRIGKSSAFRFSLVSIGGEDLAAGNRKLTLALVWQMMRCHVCLFLQTVFDKRFGRRAGKTKARNLRKMLGSGGDAPIIEWANTTVSASIKRRALPEEPVGIDWRSVSKVRSFKDSHLAKGFYFLLLLWSVDDYVVNWKLVTRGETTEDKILNARYAISVARKLGATIFLLPEDITELNAKMIMTFVGGILALAT